MPLRVAAGARAPSRKRGQDRVAALLDAAAEVFAQKGFDAATMTEVAALARAPSGSLYQFFPSKQSLASSLLAQHGDLLLTRMRALEAEAGRLSPPRLARHLARLLSDFRAQHPAFASLLESPGVPADMSVQIRQQMRDLLASILARQRPDLTPARRQALAALLHHLMKGPALWRTELPAGTARQACTELTALLLTLLEPPTAGT